MSRKVLSDKCRPDWLDQVLDNQKSLVEKYMLYMTKHPFVKKRSFGTASYQNTVLYPSFSGI